MSFFGSKLFGLSNNGMAGSSNGSSSSSISGAETIERLCDRVQSTLLIEDKKDSLNAIKSLSKKYKLEVGTQAMPILIDVLRQNKMDSELCCLSLDTLFNIMNTVDDTEAQNLPADISTQFTEMFIKDTDNVALLFELLDEFEFQTRWSTVKLFNQLVVNLTSQLQEKILQIPSGVSRLMDLLNDSREVIRNDAILLMINLTKTNANIQKIIAFESGFDRIIEIIEGEGSVLNGGVIVEDCLNLLINLLQKNYSNQNFFKEANYIKIICKYFEINNSNTNAASSTSGGTGSSSKDNTTGGASTDSSVQNWSSQKSTNLSLLLKLIRCLVAPSNQHQIISDSQRAFSHFGLLIRLCALLTLPGVPADVLSEAIRTVGEVIRGNAANQQLFSSVMMQTNPPRPIITILLLSMINEKQPFHMRCSILYCFECFLYKNETKKTEIIETLLPKENQQPSQQVTNQINSGQILCNGLFTGTDSVSNWLCAVALAHTINENNHLKEQLLRVQLAINTSGNEIKAVSLMQQCMNILIQSTSNRSNTKGDQTVADQCRFQTTISILMLMSTWLVGCPTAVNQFLSEQQNIPYLISQASSTDTEEKSLLIQGVSSFLLGLNMLFNGNQIPAYTVDNLKDTIKKRIGIEQFEHKLEYISQHEEYTKTLKLTTFTFKSMKPNDLLFDYEFARLFKSNETLILNLLSKNGAGGEAVKADAAIDESRLEQHNAIIVQYQNFIREQDLKLKEQQQVNQILTQTCSQLQEHCRQLNDRMSSMKQQATVTNEAINSEQAHLSEKLKFQARINELEVKVNLLEEKCSEQEDELCKLQREKGILQETINNLQTVDKSTELIEMKTQNQNLKKANQQLNQEQENLLTLLSEMEIKMKNYKKLLKQHGETVSDNDDDDEEEEEGELHSHDDLVENTKDVKLISSSSNSNTDQHDRENKSEPFLKLASPVDASSSSSSSLLNKQVPDLLNENNKLDITNVIHHLNPTNGESSGATTTSSTSSSASSSSNSHSNQINPMNFFGQYPPETQNFFTQPAHLTMFNLQQQQHQSEQPNFDQHHQQAPNPFQNYFK